MSVKFEKELVKTSEAVVSTGAEGKHDLVHKIGASLTKGGGASGYLAIYLKHLQENPLRTKMLTSGTLSGLQEFLASWIAHDRSKSGNYFTSRVPKMAIYGAFISAPLGHVLISMLQKIFRGRTSLKSKILQILVSNLIVSPIQNSIYLISMAIIAGARTFHQVRATVKAGFMPVMKVSWIVSPISLAFAQKFLPEHTWVPFFNIIGFIIGTYINSHTKKKRLAALRRKHYGDGSGRSPGTSATGRPGDDYDRRSMPPGPGRPGDDYDRRTIVQPGPGRPIDDFDRRTVISGTGRPGDDFDRRPGLQGGLQGGIQGGIQGGLPGSY